MTLSQSVNSETPVGLVGVSTPPTARSASIHEFRLAHAKLGPIAAVFQALRAKHAPTAAHSLRVALGISSWGYSLAIPESELELMELAALLHDVGKIGVPDRILLKGSELSPDELALVVAQNQTAVQIIQAAGGSLDLQQAIGAVPQFFQDYSRRQPLPPHVILASQMISIVDAYDSMTTEQVYRIAINKLQAFEELHRFSGVQFNPDLVSHFIKHIDRKLCNTVEVNKRWLSVIPNTENNTHFRMAAPFVQEFNASQQSLSSIFHFSLIDNMRDGVVFIDQNLRIMEWNRSAERLTGVSHGMVYEQEWSPSILQLSDENGIPFRAEECPLRKSVTDGSQQTRRLGLVTRDSRNLKIDANFIPLFDDRQVLRGAAMLFGDATDRVSLEERVQDLHAKATIDPLTRVFNRAEFDRRLPEMLKQCHETNQPLSVIVADIDFFKRVNDTYGHQAGDEALRVFASLLKRMSRNTDMVARYGGEEFVILCPGCDNTMAFERAERMRREINSLPLSALRSECITASFGVAEAHAEDTEESIFNRADRALLMAKEGGRNLVMRLAYGFEKETVHATGSTWLQWFGVKSNSSLLTTELITTVPFNLSIEKLRGFVHECKAEVLSAKSNVVSMRIDCKNIPQSRRTDDRPTILQIDVQLDEIYFHNPENPDTKVLHTLIRLAIRPTKQRDRRIGYLQSLAERIRGHFQRYLSAESIDEERRSKILIAATNLPVDWS
jgi:diguanylate cyclase (GGDEF)-like protein/PAS domain S-box-containing protein